MSGVLVSELQVYLVHISTNISLLTLICASDAHYHDDIMRSSVRTSRTGSLFLTIESTEKRENTSKCGDDSRANEEF